VAVAETSVRAALAPQCEQNFSPMNIMPKQDGQATVARRAPQCSQRVAALEAAAPHMGQLSVSAGTAWNIVSCAERGKFFGKATKIRNPRSEDRK
jgi:hypothetical protein